MNLFPHVLIRFGGGPFGTFDKLRLPSASELTRVIYDVQVQLSVQKGVLSESLHKVIGEQAETAVRLALINLRRDIFNERELAAHTLEAVRHCLPQAVYDDVEMYCAYWCELARLWQMGETVYHDELEISRHHFHDLIQAENLQKGLILSSQSLLKYGIPKYLNKVPERLSKQDRKTELSLIKYISRIYTKTSPFSTFTNLAIGRMRANGKTAVSSLLDFQDVAKPQIVSHIRLNNHLYKYLRDLLIQNETIARHFLIRPNPTVMREGESYLYLTNSNNIESFQRIPFNAALEVMQILTSVRRQGVAYSEVVQTVIKDEIIDAPTEAIEAYMNQLLAYGFLEFNIGVSGIDPDWDLKLYDKLAQLPPSLPMREMLLETLKNLRQLATRYGQATVTIRQQILNEAYEQAKTLALQLHEGAGLAEPERPSSEEPSSIPNETEDEPIAPQPDEQEIIFKHHLASQFQLRAEQIFYEDTALDWSPTFNAERIKPLIACLQQLYSGLVQFEWREDEHMRMHHYFVKKYGQDACVNLLTFYEDYYRDYKKPEAEAQHKQRQVAEPNAQADEDEPTPLLPSVQARQAQTQAWLNQFSAVVRERAVKNDEEIKLCLDHILETNKRVQVNHQESHVGTSIGVFIQLFHATNGQGERPLMGVLKNAFSGFGKMMSRFLHLFEDRVTADLCYWNQTLAEDALFIENCDASYFNANLHPPLMPFEVWMPGGHNSLPAQQQIAVTELQVGVHEQMDRLQLFHQPSQKPAYVFDLGFQNLLGRSQLFQLLEKFTAARQLSLHPLLSALERAWPDQEETPSMIQVRPRIVYENQWVLRRKAWFVPKATLPLKQPQESAWAYFARLNTWRLAQEIPTEVFVYLFQRPMLKHLDPQLRQKIGRDDYKPQYICFENPFLVNLLAKLLTKVPHTLIIEEMLPDSSQLMSIGDEKYVTEFVLQWYDGNHKSFRKTTETTESF